MSAAAAAAAVSPPFPRPLTARVVSSLCLPFLRPAESSLPPSTRQLALVSFSEAAAAATARVSQASAATFHLPRMRHPGTYRQNSSCRRRQAWGKLFSLCACASGNPQRERARSPIGRAPPHTHHFPLNVPRRLLSMRDGHILQPRLPRVIPVRQRPSKDKGCRARAPPKSYWKGPFAQAS